MTIGRQLSNPLMQTPAHEDGVENPNPWIIVYCDIKPVRFVENASGKRWAWCHIDEATTFETEDDARVKLVDWSLRGNANFSVIRKQKK